MANLLAKLGIGGDTTLIARQIDINPNPSSGQDYLYVEGDQVGFMNWLLKLLGLKDPSIRISINDSFITRVEEGKFYTVSPTSGIYGFSSGFSKDKKLLILAILLIWTIIPPIILFILYTRSGAMTASVSCFKDGFGTSIRIKSGLTGKQLQKSDFEDVFNALKNVTSNNSQFYNK
ncbi:MAG: hypothetical protein FJX99_04615 [Bacteroidetes bacterium]|nr:hypothetical protein [Bacteroidota bacterium]